MTSQEKRLANAIRECGEAIKAGMSLDLAVLRTARGFGVSIAMLDQARRYGTKGELQ